jgi:hypothetical protein
VAAAAVVVVVVVVVVAALLLHMRQRLPLPWLLRWRLWWTH